MLWGILGMICVVLWAALAAVQSAPPRPAFEVVEIGISHSATKASIDTSPAGSVIADATLGYMLRWANDLRPNQFVGPRWMGETRYKIAAKATRPASVKELKAMLQALLVERFQIAFHRESRDFPVYALVVAKGGPKLKASDSEGDSVTTNAKRLGSGGTSLRTTMTQLAAMLDGSCPDPVVDMTGLTGRYDFTLDISSYLSGMQPGDLPGILDEALRKELGLGLVHRAAPAEMMVIDRAVAL